MILKNCGLRAVCGSYTEHDGAMLCWKGGKTRINSLNKKRSLFLAKRVIKGLRLACYFDEELNYGFSCFRWDI